MFNCDLMESTSNKVEITDIRYDILKELLFFIETDRLSTKLKNDADALCELLIAADKYDVKDLKLICEQNLIMHTTKENVVEYLQIAHLYNGDILKSHAQRFIKFSKDIKYTPEFISLMQKYPELLTQIENAKITCRYAKFNIYASYNNDQ